VLQEQQRSGPSYNLNHIGRFENELFPIHKECLIFFIFISLLVASFSPDLATLPTVSLL